MSGVVSINPIEIAFWLAGLATAGRPIHFDGELADLTEAFLASWPPWIRA